MRLLLILSPLWLWGAMRIGRKLRVCSHSCADAYCGQCKKTWLSQRIVHGCLGQLAQLACRSCLASFRWLTIFWDQLPSSLKDLAPMFKSDSVTRLVWAFGKIAPSPLQRYVKTVRLCEFCVCVFSLRLSRGLMASLLSDINLGWSAAALCNSSRSTKVSSGIVWFERCRLSKEVCGLFAVTLSLQCRLPVPSLSHCQGETSHIRTDSVFTFRADFLNKRSVGFVAIRGAAWFSMSVIAHNFACKELFNMHKFLRKEQQRKVVNDFFHWHFRLKFLQE